MKISNHRIFFVVVCYSVLQFNCKQNNVNKRIYKYIPPSYADVQIVAKDSIKFPLERNTYNEIKSFNYFTKDNCEYISFFDNRSGSINIYDFNTKAIAKKLRLKKLLRHKRLYKSTVYVKNFDSIFIINQSMLYLFDSAGNLKQDLEFGSAIEQQAFFDNTQPPIVVGSKLFVAIRPWVTETSLRALNRWKPMFAFNMTQKAKDLLYSLPEIYHHNLFGYPFLEYSYCYNSKGNFVFSFPADTNIYETNFYDYHISYYGRSRYQKEHIRSVPEDAIRKDGAYREYRLRNSYGPIYFDQINKKYLRLARQKISEKDYTLNVSSRKQSVIIFDENFKIVAEPLLDSELSFASVFYRKDGRMYARINVKDEYAINLVELVIINNSGSNSH